jgi:RNA polymerase sigma factor (TIGR02999 family)
MVSEVYAELRRLAQQYLSEERKEHTLQATALVHEAFVRLHGPREIPWQNRAHYYAAAAQAMRRVLIDHARAKGTQKRGGGAAKVALELVGLPDLAQDDQPRAMASTLR